MLERAVLFKTLQIVDISTSKLSFITFWNFTEDITHWKSFRILISKTLKISYLGKKCFFYDFSKILEFNLPLNRQVLTNCWLKYSRSIRNLLLMFFIFWIMIISPKLKKKNTESKFRIDLEYFSQHLVNASRFKGKLNSRILEKS